MSFYLFQFIFLFIFSFIHSYSKEYFISFVSKILSFLVLFIPAAIRSGIGTDYSNYVRIFNNINGRGISTTEHLWQLLNETLGKLGYSYLSLFIVSSFVCYIFLMNTEKKDFFIVLITYYCYLYASSYNIIRNSIVITIAWYSFNLLNHKKKLLAYLLLCVGFFIHKTSIIFIFLYLLMDNIPIKKDITLIIAILSALMLPFINIQTILLKLPLPENFKYAYYLIDSEFMRSANRNSGMGIYLRRLVIFISYLLTDKFSNVKEKDFVNWSFLFLWISDFLLVQVYILYRVATLLQISYLIMFSHINFFTKNGLKKIGQIIIILYSILIAFIYSNKIGLNEVVPYKTIWSL